MAVMYLLAFALLTPFKSEIMEISATLTNFDK